ncbi:MAG: preprotein translocase subunit SecG [Acidobacteriota bacterium]|nr:preprotein translocase subunit SecG [Acidobacteriota bacterium]
MLYALYILHVLTCIFLILVVLLQQGKGADLSVFGGGSTQAAFGARSAATLLHKLTVGFFVLFIITTMSIAWLQSSSRGTSVLSGVAADAPPAVELQDEGTTPEGADDAALAPAPDSSGDGDGDDAQ